jgi:hypothetical protein
MKPIALATLLLVLFSGNNAALADRNSHIGSVSYGYGGYNYGHRGGYYYPPHRGGYYSTPYYGYSHHHNSNNGAAYALGGLVVGSLLTNAYLQNRVVQPVYVEQTYQVPARVVVVQQPVVQQGRRLLKDINGHCYERITDVAGNELLTELSRSACNW